MFKTEQRNPYTTNLDKMSISEILRAINTENMHSVLAPPSQA